MSIAKARTHRLLRVALAFLLTLAVNGGLTAIKPLQFVLPNNHPVTAFAAAQLNNESSAHEFSQPLVTTQWFFPLVLKNYALPTTPFVLQPGSPAYFANVANPNGCNWLGMAGQAFNMSGQAIIGLIVHLEGNGLNQDALTGTKTDYGPGGYEHYLNDHPLVATYTVQLRSAGSNLSPTYQIPTYADCNKNLVLVNFIQVQ